MSSTKYGIVVATNSAIIRKFVSPTTDAELASFPLQAGETMIQITRVPYPSTAAWQAALASAVQTALGKPPGNPQCCVIDSNGNVVNVVSADATLDAGMFPGMTLVNSTVGGIGWTWTAGGGFVAPPSGPSRRGG